MILRAIGSWSFRFAMALIIGAVPTVARATEVAVFAEVRPDTVGPNEPFELEVRVQSSGLWDPGEVVVPVPKGVKQLSQSSSQSINVINGSATRIRTETRTFVAEAPGTIVFQGIGVRRGSNFIAGSSPVVRVEAPATPPRAPTLAKPEPPTELPRGGEDVFVTAMVDKTEVSLGEPVVYTFRFYYRIAPESPSYDAPDFSGFQAYDLGQSRSPGSAVIAGVEYNYYDVRTLLYPVRTGTLTIGAAGFAFRGSFFFAREHRLATKPLTVTVKPFPEPPPEGFQGAVGQFALRLLDTPRQVSVGEPIALRFEVEGTGNFTSVSSPAPVSAGAWRVYPGRVSSAVRATPAGLQGRKSYELLLLAPDSGRQQPPLFRFVYYDPSTREYATLTTQPPFMQVSAMPVAATQRPTNEALPLRPLRSEAGEPLPDPLRPWRWLGWFVPIPFVVIAFLGAGQAVVRRWRTATPQERRAALRRHFERALASERLDAAALLKILDQWLQAEHGLSTAPSEEEIQRTFGDKAELLLQARRLLQTSVFGRHPIDLASVRETLRTWLRTVVAVVLVCLALATPMLAASGWFDQARQAQLEGQYGEAIRLYTRLAERDGETVNLLYNLATAAWRDGKPGLARYAIERAYAFAPRDKEVATNRALIAAAIQKDRGSAAAVAVGPLTVGELGWLTLSVYVLFSILLVIAWRMRSLRIAAALAFIFVVGLGGMGAYAYQGTIAANPGVVWKETALHEGPADTSAIVAVLPAGDIAQLRDAQHGWLHVQTAAGLSGWLPEDYWHRLALGSVHQGISD